ncbi:hypothetical protein [Halobacterium litoreum]|uniref:CARDB protein n=1 Tax=Halobacterium litoreum TaxID=2039234 RepID=A0ABD5NGZ1_9EURY|nr:hypothetical protein [Halobacterium litoreum]UHH12598.1 hypothetical protein LT972_10565 [Halobacterium litoreum]
MDRRRFLASVSASVPLALAGCMGGQDDGDESSTTTDEPTDTTESTDTTTTDDGPLAFGDEVSLSGDRALSVENADSTAFVVSADGSGRTVHSGNTTRYTLVTFQVDAIDDYETFVGENVTLTVNDQTYDSPVFPLGGGFNQFTAAYPVPNDVTPYTASVDLDTGDTTATWEFSARDVETITQDVEYSVTDVAAPDAVASEGSFSVDVTVDNAGDAMTFVTKVLGTAGAPTRTSFDIAAGTEKTVTVDATAPAAGDASEFEMELDWGADAATRTIAFE